MSVETTSTKDLQPQADEFQRLAAQSRTGMVRELTDFLLHNKKWWLLPIVLVLLMLGLLVMLGGTAPFIYTLF
jgi:hypothetical protein